MRNNKMASNFFSNLSNTPAPGTVLMVKFPIHVIYFLVKSRPLARPPPPPLPTDIDRCITCQESSSMRIQYKDDEQTFVTMTCDDRRLRRCTSLCTGCPKKSGVLVWNFNFETNIVAKLLHLCSFESLFIQLCYGG